MPVRFDSRPLVLRRAYTATMRATAVLQWRDQVSHGMHLFFIIAASVIARNVANQQVLLAPAPAGPEVLGKLYLVVAVAAGLVVAGVGWFGRNYDARSVASVVHLGSALFMGAAFMAPGTQPAMAIAKYVVMEVTGACLLLVFGLMLGARLGPREARRVAARVGAGGILGGLVGGAVLSLGATFIGSRQLFLLAAGLAVAPVFWLPGTPRRPGGILGESVRDRADVPELSSYGRWVAITTFLMVCATTFIDYEYRIAAKAWTLGDDKLTAFFGLVVIFAGLTSIVFQLTTLDKLLDKLGLFATAAIMPVALIFCSLGFGLFPGLISLVVLKLVDSGANMSVQQATGGLLLAPLGVRARSVWQGRIDGLARRAGQALTGLFLAAFPWAPLKVVPISLGVCAAWVLALLMTRGRYVRLLTAMLKRPMAHQPEVQAYDGGTLRLLERELERAAPARAAVILDLMEQAEHRAREDVLRHLAADEEGAMLVIDHLQAFADTARLQVFTRDPNPVLAGRALLALDEVDPDLGDQAALRLFHDPHTPEELLALAAGLLSGHKPEARGVAQRLAQSPSEHTRRAVALALGRLEPGSPPEVGTTLCALAMDPDPEIARIALGSVGKHLSKQACMVALQALRDRRTRGAGMRALADLGPPVVSPIADALDLYQDDPAVASALTWALGQIGVAAGVPALMKALRAKHTLVRLSAAVALNALSRRRTTLTLPKEELEACYEPEIRWYAILRDAGVCELPNTAAGVVLRHSVRQRAQASLETLFRLFSLVYPEDSIQVVYQALNSRDRAQRQLGLELMDTLLPSDVRRALAEAIGEGTKRPKPRVVTEVLQNVVQAGDAFLAELAQVVLEELEGKPKRRDSQLTARTGMRRSLVDQILELQSVAIFSQASAEDLQEVAALTIERTVPNDTVIFQEGDSGDAAYLLREGSVVLSHKGHHVGKLGPGDVFGIVSVLDRLPRELSATTTAPSTLLVLKAGDLHQLLADRPLLMHSVFRALTSSIREQLDRIALGQRS